MAIFQVLEGKSSPLTWNSLSYLTFSWKINKTGLSQGWRQDWWGWRSGPRASFTSLGHPGSLFHWKEAGAAGKKGWWSPRQKMYQAGLLGVQVTVTWDLCFPAPPLNVSVLYRWGDLLDIQQPFTKLERPKESCRDEVRVWVHWEQRAFPHSLVCSFIRLFIYPPIHPFYKCSFGD